MGHIEAEYSKSAPLKQNSSLETQKQTRVDIQKAQLEIHAVGFGDKTCPNCRGIGYYYDFSLTNRRQKGGYVLCSCVKDRCLCNGRPPYEYYDSEQNGMVACPARPARLALEKITMLQRISGIPERYSESFMTTIEWEPILIATDFAIDTIKLYGEKKKQGLYFYGHPGCGKTLLSCVILNEILRLYRVGVKYAKISRDVLGKLQASFNPNSEYYGEGRKIEEELGTVPVLVIDDFGVHRESDWVNLVLYDLVDARYENGLLTIITSNEPMSSWKDIAGGRLYSRLQQMCAEIHIEAPDYRQRDSKKY